MFSYPGAQSARDFKPTTVGYEFRLLRSLITIYCVVLQNKISKFETVVQQVIFQQLKLANSGNIV